MDISSSVAGVTVNLDGLKRLNVKRLLLGVGEVGGRWLVNVWPAPLLEFS